MYNLQSPPQQNPITMNSIRFVVTQYKLKLPSEMAVHPMILIICLRAPFFAKNDPPSAFRCFVAHHLANMPTIEAKILHCNHLAFELPTTTSFRDPDLPSMTSSAQNLDLPSMTSKTRGNLGNSHLY